MKPIQILGYLIIILSALLLIAAFFPDKGIKITENYTLEFPSIEEIFSSKEVRYADVSGIIEKTEVIETNPPKDTVKVISKNPKKTKQKINPDTLKAKKINVKGLKDLVQKIEYPEGERVLNPVFEELKNLKSNNQLIRILHYGDSQIEGDRITSYIRERLQSIFGGSGPGLLAPVVHNNISLSVTRKTSDNWTIFSNYGSNKNLGRHRKYGALMSYSKLKPTVDTSGLNYNGYVKIKHRNISYKRSRTYKQLRLFYGGNTKNVNARVMINDSVFQDRNLHPENEINEVFWNFTKNPKEITLKISGSESPDIYALAGDALTGIAVDNIPMRGSSGLEFTKSDKYFLKKMYAKLNVKLIILEFGVNVVPNVLDDYKFYEIGFYRQLKTLKEIIPHIPILVVGLSDMSKKENGKYVSYPNIEKIRNAQKNAAFKAGCAFWDMYEAMGGKNSMPSWVGAEPALAEKDYTHFNYRGAKVIAELFFKAFIHEYNEYVDSNVNELKAYK